MAMSALDLSVQKPTTTLPCGNPRLEFDNLLNQVHIWAVDLGQWNLHSREALQMLPESERKKTEKLRFEIHQTRYIKGHYLLRLLLGQYLGIDFYNQEFTVNEYGKPSLQKEIESNSVNFNFSNSENICVYAFTKDGELGIDIEKIHDLPEMDRIVERFFSPNENKIFRSLPEQNRKQSFFKYWARKEALLKAMGLGFSYPLNKVDVLLHHKDSSPVVTKNAGIEWTLYDIDSFEGFASALALKGVHHDCAKQVRCFNLTDKITPRSSTSQQAVEV
ncbi:MAG: 4'-phosphopantetheinyl transferase family protein [Smithellaceae bacterium]